MEEVKVQHESSTILTIHTFRHIHVHIYTNVYADINSVISHNINAHTTYLNIAADQVHTIMATIFPDGCGFFQQDNAFL